MSPRRLTCAVLLFIPISAGCGAELAATGASAAGDAPRVLTTLTGQIQNSRESSPVLGAGLHLSSSAERAVQARSALVSTGYRWAPQRRSRLGGELAIEAGGGQPSTVNYQAIGVYTGGRGALLFRMFGFDDIEPKYAILTRGVNLVLSARGGTWASPENTEYQTTVGEASASIGIRIDIGSDLGLSYPGTTAP